MNELTHLSLFSGIGGLDLAAEWAGFKTVGQCEWAEYPTKVLEKHWPDIPRWKDIRTLTGENFYERTGLRTVDLISGGFPCQPFSVAGKQRGKEDDRYLWPEMVRVIKELRPSWIVGENVAGIINMALPDILSELEAIGYETRVFSIPACAVGARHRRYRVAIMAHSESQHERGLPIGTGTEKSGFIGSGKDVQYPHSSGCEKQHSSEKSNSERFLGGGCYAGNVSDTNNSKTTRHREYSGKIYSEPKPERPCICSPHVDVCHPASAGLSDRTSKQMGGQRAPEQEPKRSGCYVSDTNNGSGPLRGHWKLQTAEKDGSGRPDYRGRTQEHESRKRRPVEPGMGRMADGFSGRLDGGFTPEQDYIINHYWDVEPDIPRIATGIRNRVERLKGLGNAVVPQQFYPVVRAIYEIEMYLKALMEKGEKS